MKKLILGFVLAILASSTVSSQSFNPDFQPYITRPGDVHQLKALPDGRFMAAGSFSMVNDVPEANIARFFADGSLDISFNSTIDFSITAMAIQEDGKVLVGGSYTNPGAPEGITVLRLNEDGSLDNTFQAGFAPSGTIEDIEIEFNGTILVGGAFNNFDGQAAQGLARLAPEGFLLQTIFLESTGTVFISDLIVLDNGRFYVAGSYQAEGYLSFRKYSGFPADGFDFTPEFPGVNNIMVGIRDIELDSQGRIVMTVGTFLIRYAVVIINTDGSMADWGYVYGIPMDLAVDSFDNILVAGEYEGVNAIHRFIPGQELIIYNGGSGCDGLIRQLEVHPTGSYLIGGAFSNFNGQTALSLERVDGFGNVFTTFNPTLERPGVVRTTAIVGDKIYIGGDFAMIGNHYSPNLARLDNTTGAADLTFSNPGLSYRNIINHLAMDNQGRILLAGTNENDGDEPAESLLLRVLPSGIIDPTFNLDPLPVGTAYKVVPIPGGLIMAVGDFTIFDPNIIASQAAVFTENGTQVSNFSERLDADQITSAHRQPDGSLLLAGRGISYDNSPPQYLLRLTPAFELDTEFQADASISCEGNCRYTFHQQSSSQLLIGGNVIAGSQSGLIRLQADGSLDNSFNTSVEFRPLDGFTDGTPRKINSFPDGTLLVVGLFDSLGLEPSSGIASFSADGTLIDPFVDLRFPRQNILDALIIDQNTFVVSGLLAEVSQNDYRSVALVNYIPPVPSEISGRLQAWWGPFITNAELGMIGTNSGNTLSNDEGEYAFTNVSEGGSYEVIPILNTSPLNGVSTLDLVLISRHILGVQPLSTPYQIIAADVNHSNSVTVFDMLDIRRVILGQEPTFSNNNSWRFVRSDYVFPQPSNPWLEAFEESYTINSLVSPGVDNADFKGIKIGDVNGDADTGGNFQATEQRQSWSIRIQEQHFKAGEVIEVPFTAEHPKGLLGFQFSITFDTEVCAFAGIEYGLAGEENFGTQASGQGLVTVSWNTAAPSTLPNDAVLFTLRLKARKSGVLSQQLSMNSSLTRAEAYFAPLKLVQPVIEYLPVSATAFQAGNFFPNPISQTGYLPFVLPKAGPVSLRVYNSQGQLIWQRQQAFPAGANEWLIRSSELPSGMVFYSVEFEGKQYRGALMVEE